MIQKHDLETVNIACELAIEQDTGQLPTVLNILHRLTEPRDPKALEVTGYPCIEVLPEANCQRYDGLINNKTMEASHAEPR